MPSPSVDVDFWLSTEVPLDLTQGCASSLRTGQVNERPRVTPLPVLWVRDFKHGVPAGNLVTHDPDPQVTLRFSQVTRAGTLIASFVPGTPDRQGFDAARTWSFQQSLAFGPGGNAVKICLRYERQELPAQTLVMGRPGPAFSIGMWGPTSTGAGAHALGERLP